jgi:hypothetical protein
MTYVYVVRCHRVNQARWKCFRGEDKIHFVGIHKYIRMLQFIFKKIKM